LSNFRQFSLKCPSNAVQCTLSKTNLTRSVLGVAALLFFVTKKGWIDNSTLQILTNVAGIVALLAAVAVFIFPLQPPVDPALIKSEPNREQNQIVPLSKPNSAKTKLENYASRDSDSTRETSKEGPDIERKTNGKTPFGQSDNELRKHPTPIIRSASQTEGYEQKDYWGEIVFNDGRTVNYTWLRTSGYGMERIPFSRELSYHENASSLNKFDVRKVAMIDFLSEVSGFDLAGKEVPEYAKVNNWIYKSNITFLDGTQWAEIYIYGMAWMWKNDYEEGHVVSAKSITINVR
jgi:hypothetical protein